MRFVTLPAWDELGRAPPVLTLGGLLTCDARPGLVALWSWSELHGGGPHLPAVVEQVAEWRGEAGVLVAALVATSWAVEVDGSITLTPWRDLLTESRTERRKRQLREASRRYRAASSSPSSTHHQRVINASSSVIKNDDGVIIPSSTVIKNDDASSSFLTPSLFSEVLQKKNQSRSREELEQVVSTPAPLAPAGLSAGGVRSGADALSATVAERLAADPSADLSDLFGPDPATAEERPAVGLGSTIDPEARSVPVPTPDRAPEADSGRPRSKRSKVKRATVDLERVDPDVRAVWTAYADAVGSRVVLSAARVDLIAARLADGWTVDDLSTACRGYGASPFHSGDNDRGQRYQTLELWLRDAAHVEAGIAFTRSPPASKRVAAEPLAGVNDYWEDLMRQRAAAEQASANGAKK